MDSWEGIKRDGTTVLEAEEIKGLKISLGNALHSTRNYSRRNLIQGQILSPVLNMCNGVLLHLLSILYNTLKIVVLICSLLLCFLILCGILLLPLFQIAIESGTCWVGLNSGESNKQI